MSQIFKRSLFFVSIFFIVSCARDMPQGWSPKATAFGKINEIIIVADDELWDGPTGDSIRFYFSSAYPLMPQPEPIFDLRHYTPQELKNSPSRKELRTYMVVGNLNDPASSTTKMIKDDLGAEKMLRSKEDPSYTVTVGKDKWAEGQILMYLFAYSEEALIDQIIKKFPSLADRVNQHDHKRVENVVYFKGVNKYLGGRLRDSLGFTVDIPLEYIPVMETNDFMWMRKETREVSYNVMLHSLPYTQEGQLTKEGIKEIRDKLGKNYIQSPVEGSYMKVNDIDLPILEYKTNIDGKYGVIARGIWEMEADFAGGPFFSYLLLNEDTNRLAFVDVFVLAPGEEKRNHMQQLELIAQTVKFN